MMRKNPDGRRHVQRSSGFMFIFRELSALPGLLILNN